MRLNIIGPGVVGTATGEGFRRFGHEIVYSDKGEGVDAGADLHIVCTPEGSVPDVLEAIYDVADLATVVVRSSTPPGTLSKISKEHQVNIWHNPEFLRERNAQEDFLSAQYAIVGHAGAYEGSDGMEACFLLDGLYAQMNIPVAYCSSTDSEMVKLVTNSHLATLVSFWNEVGAICSAAGLNSHAVARLVMMDPRVSPYGAIMHGAPYGGSCLPKDLTQLVDVAASLDVAPTLLRAVKLVNFSMARSKEDES